MSTTTSLIPAAFEPAVRAAVESGRYDSERSIVAEALRLWQQREEQLEELRSQLKRAGEQLDRGEKLDGKIVIQKMRARLARVREMEK